MSHATSSIQLLHHLAALGDKNIVGILRHASFKSIEKSIADCDSIKSPKDRYTELAKRCADRFYIDPDWQLLAGRVMVHYVHSITESTFSAAVASMERILHPGYVAFVKQNADQLNSIIVDSRDYNYNMLNISILTETYLARIMRNSESCIAERPQYCHLRQAVFLWFSHDSEEATKWANIKDAYEYLSTQVYTHATPTIFNAGMKDAALSSCFLMGIQDDTNAIADSWRDSALISKGCGGLGINYSNIRHSEVAERKQTINILNWIKIQESILVTMNQGNRRKGSAAAFLNIWHIDVELFIGMRVPTNPDHLKVLGMYNALWIPDEFMRRVINKEDWTLFCPHVAPELLTAWGEEFNKLYRMYEARAEAGRVKYFKKVNARALFKTIINAQIVSGTPYILYGDSINRKCNQSNLGTITCSNLCSEITLYTDKDNIASCNLANLILGKFVTKTENGAIFDYKKLHEVTRFVTRSMDRVIDMSFYNPHVPEIERTNKRNRPLGIGVQGLADVFALMDVAWESTDAKLINRNIFETIYHACVEESVDLARKYGAYETFPGSPASRGLFQFDMWDNERLIFEESTPGRTYTPRTPLSGMYDWEALRVDMKYYGLRHSMLTALMPTASTALINNSTECFEPNKQNIHMRTVLAGQYVDVNEYCVRDLMSIGMWTTETLQSIWDNRGSIRNLDGSHLTPELCARLNHVKNKYKTAYEISQKHLIDLAVDRGRFVCQSQSFNCFMETPTIKTMTAYHIYGWKAGMKTGMYYCRQMAPQSPINFSKNLLVIHAEEPIKEEEEKPQSLNKEAGTVYIKDGKTMVCTDEVCIMCQ